MDFNLKFLVTMVHVMNPSFVTIGADSKGHGLVEPGREKVEALIKELGDLHIEIRQKKNLDRLISRARICVCDNIIQEQECPVCGSKQQLFVGKIMGYFKETTWKK